MKKSLLLTVAAFVLVSESRIAVADSTDDAIRRLEAKIDTMAKENAALRTRLNRIEGTRATSTAHVAATSAAAVSAKQEPSNAMAASYPVKAVPAVAPPPWNWTGLYLGGHLGAGLFRNQFSHGTCTPGFNNVCDTLGASSDLGSHNGLGILGGVQVGYNWQFSNSPVVVGIEGTYSFADLKGDHQNSAFVITANFDDVHIGQERFASQTRGIATIVGRLGIASGPQDRTLWYVKGGAAWANTKLSANGNYITQIFSDQHPMITSFDGASKRWGWTVGTGVEFGLFDNWSAKIEYDYLDFGTKDVAFNGNACHIEDNICAAISRNVSLNQQIHMVNVGLNYRLNWWR